jgi:nucleotide-binding universal stress UspA family protein
MIEIDDERLVDWVLGLRDDAQLEEALPHSPELRRRFGEIAGELCHLDTELQALSPRGSVALSPPTEPTEPKLALANHPWHILFVIAGSQLSQQAASAAARLALRSAGEVEVFYVRKRTTENREKAAELVERVLSELRGQQVTARGRVETAPWRGTPKRIVCEAEAIGADVIVMSPDGTSLRRRLLSRVVDKVTRQAPCPVLLAR